jgi:hypothetical protein
MMEKHSADNAFMNIQTVGDYRCQMQHKLVYCHVLNQFHSDSSIPSVLKLRRTRSQANDVHHRFRLLFSNGCRGLFIDTSFFVLDIACTLEIRSACNRNQTEAEKTLNYSAAQCRHNTCNSPVLTKSAFLVFR